MTDELRAVPKGISGAFLGEHKQIDAIDDVNRKNYADGTTENERGSGWAGSLSGTEAYRKSLFNTGLSGSSNEGDL